ncbi:MAG: hypothetical protein Q4B69_05090, partial [Slackia sp.]|nr:hypothetical protein [Slackia sp.]
MMERSEQEIMTGSLKTWYGKAIAIALSFVLAVTLSPIMPQAAYADEAAPEVQSAPAGDQAAVALEGDASDAAAVSAGDGAPSDEQGFEASSDASSGAGEPAPDSTQTPASNDGATAAGASDAAPAADTVITIKSFSDLLGEVLASRTQDTSNVHYVLDLSDAPDKTLDLTSEQVDQIVKQIGSLTFGSKDNPFRGTFDGNGYTIKGLNYERDLFVPAPD